MSEPTLRLLSLGAGVQSTVLALMATEGILSGLDGAIFADTGWEPRRVYEHLSRLEKVLASAGIPLYRVSRGNLRDDVLSTHAHATIPAYTRSEGQPRGVIGRRCTGRYKVEPIERQIRRLLGAPDRVIQCRYCVGTGARAAPWDPGAGMGTCSVCRGDGERTIVGRVPAGKTVEQWIGFSTDEIGRVNNGRFPPYIRPRYPLLEKGWSREQCMRWLDSLGWTEVAKSACVGCPYNGNRRWRELRDHYPAEWADAVEFDHAFRTGAGLDSERFLHASRMPLDQAPIDHITRAEWRDMQPSLLDLLEDGDPDGCSPYGCRSGEPVEVPDAA